LQQLVRSRLIRSQRGTGGGYTLVVPAAAVSLLDVVEAMEGPIRLNQCLEEGPSCDRKSWCPAHQVWAEAQLAVAQVLGAASIAKLAAQAETSSPALYQRHDKPIWIAGIPRKGNGRRIHRSHGP